VEAENDAVSLDTEELRASLPHACKHPFSLNLAAG